MHVRNEEAPVSVENVPAGQFVQLEEPIKEYFPAEHGVHCVEEFAPTADENVPASHFVQLFTEKAPNAFEYVPAGHLIQFTEELLPIMEE